MKTKYKQPEEIKDEVLTDNLRIISKECDIPIPAIRSKIRNREIVFARQLFCWTAHKYFTKPYDLSLATIGGAILRNHSTVIHSIKTINNLIETNRHIQRRVENTEEKVQQLAERLSRGGGSPLTVSMEAEYPIGQYFEKMPLKAFIEEEIRIPASSGPIPFPTGITVMIPKMNKILVISTYGQAIILDGGDHEVYVNFSNPTEEAILVKPFDEIGHLMMIKEIGFSLVQC